jgi:hypothetical protein
MLIRATRFVVYRWYRWMHVSNCPRKLSCDLTLKVSITGKAAKLTGVIGVK